MVTKRPDESLDELLKRFKRQISDAGIMLDYKKHLEYIGPSEKRRLKSEQAQKRARKFQKKNSSNE